MLGIHGNQTYLALRGVEGGQFQFMAVVVVAEALTGHDGCLAAAWVEG